MPIDTLNRVRRGWQSVTDARSKVEKRQSEMPKAVQLGSSCSLAIRLKQAIAGLNFDDPSDQECAVEKFVSIVLAEELGLKDLNGVDFHELVSRVVIALSEGGARSDLLKTLATIQ